MSEPAKAVFLSYASQDAEAARRICESLRAGGIEVWFDVEGGLEHGDEWDAKIRRQIKECVLFLPVISANTQAREEGYFRIEWELAAERAMGIASGVAFILPIVIDDTKESDALVPDRFRKVQWTRLPGGVVPPEVQARFLKLWSHRAGVVKHRAAQEGRAAASTPFATDSSQEGAAPRRDAGVKRAALIASAAVVLLVAALGWWLVQRPTVPVAKPAAAATGRSAAKAAIVDDFPREPELRKAMDLVHRLNSTVEEHALAEDLTKAVLSRKPTDPEALIVSAYVANRFILRGFDISDERYASSRKLCERALALAPDDPEAMHVMGQSLSFRGADWVRAEQLLRRAVTLAPDRPRFYNSFLEVLERVRPDEALSAARAAVARFPDDAILRYRLAMLHSGRGELDSYDRALDETLAVGPVGTAVIRKATLAMIVHGDLAAARQWLARLPESFRTNDRTVWTEYLVASASGEVEGALQSLAAWPGNFLRDFSVWPKRLLIADLYARQGKRELARTQYEAALADIARERTRDPSLTLSRAERWALLGLGRRDEAQKGVDAMFSAIPRPYELRGKLLDWFGPVPQLLLLGARDKALELLRELAQDEWSRRVMLGQLRVDPHLAPWRDDAEILGMLTKPGDAKPVVPATPAVSKAAGPATASATTPARELIAKATALFKNLDVTREDFALAEDLCERAFKLEPTDAEVCAAYSSVHAMYILRGWDTSAERRERVRVMAERAIRLDPKSRAARVAQVGAWDAFEINQPEVERVLRELMAEDPTDQWVLRFLASTLIRQGRISEGIALNEKSAALPGGDPLALYNIARAYWGRRQPEAAHASIERALAQRPFSSGYLLKSIMELSWRGDLEAAKAALKKIPEPALQEDRANYAAGLLHCYERRPQEALKVWQRFPRDFYADFQFDGPKGYLIGLAYELDGRAEAARSEWRAGLQLVEKRLASSPNNPALLYWKAMLHGCLGDRKSGEETLVVLEQLESRAAPGEAMPVPQIFLYLRLGRLDDVLASLPASLERRTVSGLWPARLRLDPRFDVLRGNPRVDELLAKYPLPGPEAKK